MNLGLGLNIKTSGGAAFSIDSLSGLEIWLKFNTGQTTPDIDADGDTDIHWADQSGNGNDATQNTDAREGSFNSGAWLSADNGDFLAFDSAITLTDDYTIFIVFKTDADKDTFIGGTDGNNLMRISQSSTTIRIRHTASANQNDLTYETGVTPTTSSHALFRVERNASDEFSLTQNSTTVIVDEASVYSNPFVAAYIPAGSYGIGDRRLYELVIFDRTLTASEISKVEADILDRTSLTAD